MSYLQIKRNRYLGADEPVFPEFYPPHNRADGNNNDLHSRDHEEDMHNFHLPLSRMHNATLHDGGVAQGLSLIHI